MNHIYYQTKTNKSNTGDILINKILIHELREYGRIHANCALDVSAEFIRSLGLRPEENEQFKNEFGFVYSVLKNAIAARKAGDCVYVFSGPGDMYGGSWKLALRNVISMFLFALLRLFGVTIVRIGRSFGPVTKVMAISEWMRSLGISHYYVRDSHSMERCRKMGIRKVKVCPDLSWAYRVGCESRAPQTNRVMVNLRGSVFGEKDAAFIEATIRQSVSVLEELEKVMGVRPTVCVAHQVGTDRTFSKYVYKCLKDKFDVEFVEKRMMLEDFERYYGSVDYHISNRMHSLLVGYKYGSLPIAVIDTKKHVKISYTLKDCFLDALMVDIYDAQGSERVKELAENRNMMLGQLRKCEEEKQLELKAILDFIFFGA